MNTIIQQYKAIKRKYPEALLLFGVGDYYEVFNEDAQKASEILGLDLKTSKAGEEIRKATSFPCFSLDINLQKLVKSGHKVAVCDQLEDPKKTKKNVKRGVTDLF